MITDHEINFEMQYQRGHRWTPAQQSAFVGYVLEGGPIPDIWLRELPVGDPDQFHFECIDGKQRSTALFHWWSGKIAACLSKQNGHRRIWVGDLSDDERRYAAGSFRIRAQLVTHITEKQVVALALRINGQGGTPHTPKELADLQAYHDSLPDWP